MDVVVGAGLSAFLSVVLTLAFNRFRNSRIMRPGNLREFPGTWYQIVPPSDIKSYERHDEMKFRQTRIAPISRDNPA